MIGYFSGADESRAIRGMMLEKGRSDYFIDLFERELYTIERPLTYIKGRLDENIADIGKLEDQALKEHFTGLEIAFAEVSQKLDNIAPEKYKEILSEIKRQREQEWKEEAFIMQITSTLVRISAVFLSIYLIQILVSFTRYQFRIADHLDAVADALVLCGGEPDKLQKVAILFSPQHIQFGKMPATPAEQGLEVIGDLVSKLPTKG